MKITINIILIFAIHFTFGFYNFSSERKNEKKILDCMQGRWSLYQNAKQEILVKADSIFYFNEGIEKSKFILRIKKSVVSNIFERDTIMAVKGSFFLEELNLLSQEVEFQYLIISYDRHKFVLSPLHSNELLTYKKIRK